MSGPALSGLGRKRAVWHPQEGTYLRRLYSTFAQGWPGAGLLTLRLVACGASAGRAFQVLTWAQPIQQVIPELAAIIAGALLAAGLWTPVAGCLVAVFALWNFLTESGDPWTGIHLAAVGAALTMIGPGVWSVDARLFGWRRIVIREGEQYSPYAK